MRDIPLTPIFAVFPKFIKFVPPLVWAALAASIGFGLLGAGAGLRFRRRAHLQAGQFAAVAAAAATDSLTGVLNRRGFTEAVERELARASRYDRPFMLAYVDVRGLKALNDTEGHLVGDDLLRAVGVLLKDSARADDVVGRLGGDEFGLLLPEQSAEGAVAVMRRIRAQVPEQRTKLGVATPWDLTIGVAAFPDDGHTFDQLLATADRRLYEQRGIELRQAS